MSLPEPDGDARAHSQRVAAAVARAITAAGGWISFADYMQLVLYAPGLGYYSAGTRKFGAGGDFSTAPEMTPLFGRCLARVCRRVLGGLGGGVILEAGGGSGALAATLLATLADAPPERYFLLEVSAELRERQRQALSAAVPQLLHRVEWLDALPATPLRGVVLANEVLDALPTERLCRREDGVDALGVAGGAGELHWERRPAPPRLADAVAALESSLGGPLPTGYCTELNLLAPPWTGSLGDVLGTGLMLLVDYGGTDREVYHPDRRDGTLACHYRHRAHGDPFLWPGLQDITAWVDFSRVARAGRAAGLDVLAYGTQAHFLLANGFLDELARVPPEAALQASRVAQALLLPGEMGERFKVLALGRGMAEPGALVTRNLRAALVPEGTGPG